jgi:4'-phosphopantetheinyl transferase
MVGCLGIAQDVAVEGPSEQERERAAGFASPAQPPRRRYVAARAILRGLLNRYTGIPARDIMLDCRSHGKPFLNTNDKPGLRFNLSHSGDLGTVRIYSRPGGRS